MVWGRRFGLRHDGVVVRDWRDDRIAELEAMVVKLLARVADPLTGKITALRSASST